MSKTLTAIVMTAALGLGMLMGCDGRVTKRDVSGVTQETAVVVKRVYEPSQQKTGVSPRMYRAGCGMGMGVNGGFGPACGGLVITSKTIPEKNQIVFDGDIDFDIDNKEVYGRFNEGDKVLVSYREVYKSTYQDRDNDGEKELIAQVQLGYEFVDAQLIKK